jgi:ribosomal protein S18 acetylase RimI-like enzyme
MPDLTVCRLFPHDWPAYRAIRLAMLQESPRSFGSTYAHAASLDEQLWTRRLAENVVFLARVGQSEAGSAMYSEPVTAEPGDCSLFGLWVDPRFRGVGVGRALVGAVIAQARAQGKRRVVLQVVADNDPAAGLYERAGFVATGRTALFPHDNQVLQVELECLL